MYGIPPAQGGAERPDMLQEALGMTVTVSWGADESEQELYEVRFYAKDSASEAVAEHDSHIGCKDPAQLNVGDYCVVVTPVGVSSAAREGCAPGELDQGRYDVGFYAEGVNAASEYAAGVAEGEFPFHHKGDYYASMTSIDERDSSGGQTDVLKITQEMLSDLYCSLAANAAARIEIPRPAAPETSGEAHDPDALCAGAADFPTMTVRLNGMTAGTSIEVTYANESVNAAAGGVTGSERERDNDGHLLYDKEGRQSEVGGLHEQYVERGI